MGRRIRREIVCKKTTRLIDARAKLSVFAQRVLALAIAKLKFSRTDGMPTSRFVQFTTREYTDLLEAREARGGTLYKQLGVIARELRRTEVDIPQFNRGERTTGFLMTGLAASVELQAQTGVFEIEFSSKLMPYLKILNNQFGMYELHYAFKLTCKYAFRLYEIAKSWEDWKEKDGSPRPWKTLSLGELRKLLGIEPHEYKLYADLKRRVLESARQQIERTDVSLEYEELREGRKVVGIRFCLRSKPAPELPLNLSPEPPAEPAPPVVHGYTLEGDPEQLARFERDRAKFKKQKETHP